MQVNILIAKFISFTWWQRPSGLEHSYGVQNALLQWAKKGYAWILHVVLPTVRGEISCTVQSPSGWCINIQHLVKPIRQCKVLNLSSLLHVFRAFSSVSCRMSIIHLYEFTLFRSVRLCGSNQHEKCARCPRSVFLDRLHIQMNITENHSPREHLSNSNKQFSEYQTWGHYSSYLGYVSMPYLSFELMTQLSFLGINMSSLQSGS